MIINKYKQLHPVLQLSLPFILLAAIIITGFVNVLCTALLISIAILLSL
jgi:hypothetical protein